MNNPFPRVELEQNSSGAWVPINSEGSSCRVWHIEEWYEKEMVFEGPALCGFGGVGKVQRQTMSTVFLHVGTDTCGPCITSLVGARPPYVLTNDHHEDLVI